MRPKAEKQITSAIENAQAHALAVVDLLAQGRAK